ncbi:16987_t:CDS:2 [Dentiscutata erythropus]|uniref:16987_t:CDS:1 n=1 Tax=Dentiscutata erythropus TaxID=1348616 RepID=A0A9N9G586_9GLOM|nr:16987_t:CDS:2 [Dentiscutata erythropus]
MLSSTLTKALPTQPRFHTQPMLTNRLNANKLLPLSLQLTNELDLKRTKIRSVL